MTTSYKIPKLQLTSILAYNDAEARVPAGDTDGGEWSSDGGSPSKKSSEYSTVSRSALLSKVDKFARSVGGHSNLRLSYAKYALDALDPADQQRINNEAGDSQSNLLGLYNKLGLSDKDLTDHYETILDWVNGSTNKFAKLAQNAVYAKKLGTPELKAMGVEYAVTQKVLAGKFGDSVTLYRGVSGKYGADALDQSKKGSVSLITRGADSWTSDKRIAAADGEYVMESKVPIDRIVTSYLSNHVVADSGENEFVVVSPPGKPLDLDGLKVTKGDQEAAKDVIKNLHDFSDKNDLNKSVKELEAHVDSEAKTGTKVAGYAEPKYGPFRCDNCMHYDSDESGCSNTFVLKDTELKTVGCLKAVEPHGCCTYFRNKDADLQAYGTSEGVKKEWDSRGRGVSKAIDHLNDKYPANPDNPVERNVLIGGKKVGDFEVIERDGRLRIRSIQSSETGAGSWILNRILKAADEAGVTVELTAASKGSHKLSTDQLVEWYGRYGFKLEPDYDEALHYMVRDPKPKIHAYGTSEGVKKEWDERGRGRHDDEGAVFVSPNEEEDTKFDTALKGLRTAQHKGLHSLATKIIKEVDHGGDVTDAVGDWSDGAENSLVVQPHTNDPQKIKLMGAMLGLQSRQKYVIPWVTDKSGSDRLYHFTTNQNLHQVRSTLDNLGVQFRTLAQGENNSTTVYVFDQGNQLKDTMGKVAEQYGDIKVARGKCEFFGDDDRNKAGDIFRTFIEGQNSGRDRRVGRPRNDNYRRSSGKKVTVSPLRASTQQLVDLIKRLKAYGTSEGVKKEWDERGRGQKEKPHFQKFFPGKLQDRKPKGFLDKVKFEGREGVKVEMGIDGGMKTNRKELDEKLGMPADQFAKALVSHFKPGELTDVTVAFDLNPWDKMDADARNVNPHMSAATPDAGVVTMERMMNLNTGVVYHNELHIGSKASQGKDIAKKLMDASLDLYDNLGITKISTFADVDVGGYAWARYGFVPDEYSWKNLREDLLKGPERLPHFPKKIADHLSPEVQDIAIRLLKSDSPKAIRALAALQDPNPPKGEKHTAGQNILLGTDWDGSIDLSNKQDYSTIREYVSHAR